MYKKINKWGSIRKEMLKTLYTRMGPYLPEIRDQFTGLSTLISLFPKLKSALSKGTVGMLYIDIVGFSDIETLYGRDLCNRILFNTGIALKALNTKEFEGKNKLGVCSLGGDDFLVFIQLIEHPFDYQRQHSRLKIHIENSINEANKELGLAEDLAVHLGYTEMKKKNDYQIESLIYSAVKEASFSAKNYRNIEEQAHRQLIKQIIADRDLKIVYQPIVSLGSGGILGYEALTRGPANTCFESPESLFMAAERFQCIFELESLCHELAVQNASSLLGDRYLFLNVNPWILNAANHKKGRTRAILREYGIDFNKVVLELTERTAINDYGRLREALNYYRNQGFYIAIDDAGAGYSSLQAISELQPEFVKIDMSLVRNVNQDPTKKAILETFVDFSYKISSRIICEGIENQEELKALIDMGCDYGQGYLLGQPGPMQQDMDIQIQEHIRVSNDKRRNENTVLRKKIGDIVMYHPPVKSDIPVHLVVDMFKDRKFVNGMVVCEDMKPLGLVMREKISTMLGTKYGYDLFMRRNITEVMDRHPLILPWFTPIDEAARQVAERQDKGLTDYVIVTKDDRYQGVVSVSKMIDTMATIHIKEAKDANPLTGLPGNRCITERIIMGLAQDENMAVLYFDLDNFKAFNDHYGFEHGDRALILLARIISQVTRECGNKDDLVGHIGGDDFVVITNPGSYEGIAIQVIKMFDQLIIDLYDQQAIDNGYIIASNRKGETAYMPIMTVSIAGVVNQDNTFKSHLHLGEVAADVKKMAKAQAGSCYYFDQRK